MKPKFLSIPFLAVMLLSYGACTEQENVPPPPNEPDSPAVSEGDLVRTTYTGAVCMEESDDALINYMLKRFTNISLEHTDDTRLVVLGEKRAEAILSDPETFSRYTSYWYNNNALGLIRPGENCLTLLKALELQDIEEAKKHVTPEMVNSQKNIHLRIARADGHSMDYLVLEKQYKKYNETFLSYDDNNNVVDSINEERSLDVQYMPSEYEIGRIAERAAEWMNDYFKHHLSKDVRLTSKDDNTYETVKAIHQVYIPVRIEHTLPRKYYWIRPEESSPQPVTVEARATIQTVAGYNSVIDGDVYDLKLQQEYNSANIVSYIKFKTIHKHLEYNWRYSGGYYYGPTVEVNLHGSENSKFSFQDNSSIYEPAPQNKDKEYVLTHYPATTTLGGSISVGGSAGTGGIGADANGSFSVSCTLPYTTVSEPVEGMPMTFSSNNRHNVKWNFQTNHTLHSLHWGFNPDFNEPPAITKGACPNEEAVTFSIKNSKLLKKEPVYIDVNLDFKTYHELGRATIEDHDALSHYSPQDHYKSLQSHCYAIKNYQMPQVYRYFEDYTPFCFYTSGVVDGSSGWTQFNTTLLTNDNYRALAEDDLIRAVVEEDLDINAEKVWRKALSSLLQSYNGSNTIESYIVALADEDNNHLSVGLYVHDGIWEIVEDVDLLKKELTEKAK